MPMKYYEQIKNQEIPPMDTGDVPAFLVDIVISEDTEKTDHQRLVSFGKRGIADLYLHLP